MTDASAAGTHAELQPGPVGGPSNLPASTLNGASASEIAAPDDPSSTIKCICGYNDDDGNTVLCEICNTWQHIECYYPDQIVPDVHECYDDRPRTLDAKGARERQTQLRELQVSEDRRTRRPKSSTHRKKTKDSISMNGWTGSDHGGDRPGDSPRDQLPTAKKPKTSHKASSSITSINLASSAANARRKPGSLGPGQSPVKSPSEAINGYSGDYYSPEFMQLHQRPPYQRADGNFMTSIGVTNDLAAWVQDSDEVAKVTHGEPPNKVFWRIDTAFEDLEEMCPGITRHADEDKTILINGVHPVIQRMTVDGATPQGAFIGELRGHISRRDEYKQDLANRWAILRHPEPFVFFPPYLPIVLDARDEGTELRYVRRSCKPNTKIRIIIDKARDYHFCLVSESYLNEGDEITLRWDMDEDVMHILATLTSNGSLKREGIHGEDEYFICAWASRVLANFGGCACGNPGTCLLGRFDRRTSQQHPELANAALKLPRNRKGKKSANHAASPLSTGKAVNSRASSEAANAKPELLDDRADSRSVSGSSKSKPTSRDNTPGVLPSDLEISGREKRKLEQLEKRFDALGQDDTPARKKKRNSAGSALTTPGIGNSKQFGLGLHELQHPSSPFASASKHVPGAGLNGINGHLVSSPFRHGRISNRTPPIQARAYLEASTQTDIGAQNDYNTALAPCKRRRISYSQRIFARTRDEKPRSRLVEPNVAPADAVELQDATSAGPAISEVTELTSTMLPPPRPASSSATADMTGNPQLSSDSFVQTSAEVVMHDVAVPVFHADKDSKLSPLESVAPAVSGADTTGEPHIESPDEAASLDKDVDSASASSIRPQNLHVTLPPVPNFSSPTPTTPSMTATPGSITGSSIAQSPMSTSAALPHGPLVSPAVLSSVAPSPLKKKMSLSDYTSRKRAAAKEAAVQAVGSVSEAKSLSATAKGSLAAEEGAPEPDPDPEAKDDDLKLERLESTAVEETDEPLAPVRGQDDEAGDASAATDAPIKDVKAEYTDWPPQPAEEQQPGEQTEESTQNTSESASGTAAES